MQQATNSTPPQGSRLILGKSSTGLFSFGPPIGIGRSVFPLEGVCIGSRDPADWRQCASQQLVCAWIASGDRFFPLSTPTRVTVTEKKRIAAWPTMAVLTNGFGPSLSLRRIGVLFGCLARKIDGDSWFAWWFNHLPGPSFSPKRTPTPYSKYPLFETWVSVLNTFIF